VRGVVRRSRTVRRVVAPSVIVAVRFPAATPRPTELPPRIRPSGLVEDAQDAVLLEAENRPVVGRPRAVKRNALPSLLSDPRRRAVSVARGWN